MNKRIVRNLCSARVITAVVSAVSAVICAVLAGCKLSVDEVKIRNLESSLVSIFCPTNSVIGD